MIFGDPLDAMEPNNQADNPRLMAVDVIFKDGSETVYWHKPGESMTPALPITVS